MSMREELLAAACALRVVPVATLEAMRILHKPDADMDAIIQTIERDPGWTANLLRLANSAYFGCPRSVRSVREAVVRLGRRNLTNLMVGAAVLPMLRGSVGGGNPRAAQLWQHSLSVAVISDRLASAAGVGQPRTTFTAAILHDVGKLLLRQAAGGKTAAVMDMIVRQKLPEVLAERLVLGIDHAELGAAVMTHWNLPQDVVDIVARHHESRTGGATGDSTDLVVLANMAASIAESRQHVDRNYVELYTSQAASQLHLSPDKAMALIQSATDVQAAAGRM